MSLRIRSLTAVDLDASEALVTLAFGRQDVWRSDIELYLELEPEGCYVAVREERIVGMGGCINYGPFAWIGLMGVHPEVQGQGIGRAILERIVTWTQAQHCPVAVLDASESGAPLYSHAGFVDRGMTSLFERDVNAEVACAAPRTVLMLHDTDLPDLFAFDRRIFAADRTRVLIALLTQNPNRTFLIHDAHGAVAGYVIAQSGRIGPLLTTSPEYAEALLAAALTLTFAVPPVMYVPSKNVQATQLLSRYGFVPRRALRHMYRGSSPTEYDRSHTYSQASFSLG